MSRRIFSYFIVLCAVAATFVLPASANAAWATLQFGGASNSCVDIPSGADTNYGRNLGIWVQAYGCHGGNPQTFDIVHRGSGRYSIRSAQSGYCLDVQASGTANGTPVIQYYCNSNQANQLWTLPYSSYGNGWRFIKSVSSGKCFAIPTSTNRAVITSCATTPTQAYRTLYY